MLGKKKKKNSFVEVRVLCCAQSLSCVRLLEAPWTVAGQVPLSMGFFRQAYWGGLLFPSPGDLPDAGVEPASLVSPALAGRFLPLFYLGSPLLRCD